MDFRKDFDQLLAGILTDWQNQFPGADVSQGSLIFIKSACLASALWGIYRHQDWISKQIFPDTAESEYLEHHCWVREITRKAGESDADYLARLLDHLRSPPAGGNRYDYVKWAMEIDGVKAGYCFPLAQGESSVDVVVVADIALTGSELPSQALLDEVAAYIDGQRPVTARFVRVLAPTILAQDVTMTVTGSGVNRAQVEADIESYLGTFVPGQSLYLSRLISIAIDNGAEDALITVPAAVVTPQGYEMIRAGVIDVA